jgi:hypothetical protein
VEKVKKKTTEALKGITVQEFQGCFESRKHVQTSALHQMDSTLKEIKFVTPKNIHTIFYYKIPVSFGSPFIQVGILVLR